MARNQDRIGPYSRKLRRGAIGSSTDGRSAEGRFIRDLEAQLIAHVGGSPSIAQKLLIDRIIKTTMQVDALDAKLAEGTWTDHDSRTHGGLINRQRLLLREIGMKPAAARQPTLAEHFAAKRAAAAA
ncbi:MAG TPA: hypothetical protein VHY35_05255 [Stellaceae bacterium]|jgi:hypothetical protein|nr:hypothetical protein [Stellaceae bacterium]